MPSISPVPGQSLYSDSFLCDSLETQMTLALELTTLGLEPNFGLRCTMLSDVQCNQVTTLSNHLHDRM